MVLFGGLEIVAAGYLLHKHNQCKKERIRLEEEAAALEEQQYPLQEKPRPHRRHSHSHSEEDEERRERRRRRRSRERREREKFEYEGRPPRMNSAPPGAPKMQTQRPAPRPAQVQVEPGVVAGWPAHWKQTQQPPTAPPQPQQMPIPANQYPPDIKYGFVPDIPHDRYPSYPPPPFSAGPAPHPRHDERRGRAETLEVRGRHSRRNASPNLGEYDDYSRSPGPRVRFSNEDEVLGGHRDAPPKYTR